MNATLINRILLVLACAGIFVAGYLSMAHWIGANVACGIGDGCDTIANSKYARIPFNLDHKGFPVAGLGLLAYVILAAIALTRTIKGDRSGSLTNFGLAFSAIGFLGSMALMYVAFGIIRATCTWCVASAIIMTAMFLLHLALKSRGGELPAHFSPAFTGVLAILTLGGLGYQGGKLGGPEMAPLPGPIEKMIPKDPHTFGDATSSLVIVEFVDLTCAHCKETYAEFKRLLGSEGAQFQVVIRHFPLIKTAGHEMALPAAGLSELAAEKGRFFQFLDLVFGTEHEALTMDKMLAYLQGLGVDPAEARKRIVDTKDPAFIRMKTDIDEADRLGLQQTPAFFIGFRGGKEIWPARKDGFQRIMFRPDIQKVWDVKLQKK